MTETAGVTEWVVLIADDEPDNLQLIAESLRFFGAKEVITARNGIETLHSLDSCEPSFILLDIAMPELDGWEVLKHIRDDDNMKDLPVIGLSAHAMQTDKERAIAAGFDGYITKPVNIPTLLNDINGILATISRKEENHE